MEFLPDKIISTLEGGIVATDNEKLYYRLLSKSWKNFNNLSKIKNLNQFSYIKLHWYKYKNDRNSTAVGFVQLDYLNNWVEKRNDIIKYLEKGFVK